MLQRLQDRLSLASGASHPAKACVVLDKLVQPFDVAYAAYAHPYIWASRLRSAEGYSSRAPFAASADYLGAALLGWDLLWRRNSALAEPAANHILNPFAG